MKKKFFAIAVFIVIAIFALRYHFVIDREYPIVNENDIITSLYVNGKWIDDETKIKMITKTLSKYNFTGHKRNLYYYKREDTVYEIDFMLNQEIRHIILGKINVIYESFEASHEIFNGENLIKELDAILTE